MSYFETGSDSLVCQVCGAECSNFKSLGHHIKSHGYTPQSYYDEYCKHNESDGICKTCGKVSIFKSIRVGYKPFCCIQCSNSNTEKIEKFSKTVKGFSEDKREEIRTKTRATSEERYGGIGNASGVLAEKRRKTCLERYGDENYSNHEKAVKTYRSKTGYDYSFQSPEFIQESLEKKRAKYNGDVLDRGKVKETLLERYGTTVLGEINQDISKAKKRASTEKGLRCGLNDLGIELIELSEDGKTCKCSCKVCGTQFEYSRVFIYHTNRSKYNPCSICNPRNVFFSSNAQEEIVSFIQSIYKGHVEVNNRTLINPNEVDIYLSEMGVAFEYDGLYWHSTKYKDAKYHLDKTNACMSKGVRLYHIFENEWVSKTDIVKSRIENILGLSKIKVYARKCEVRDVDNVIARTFLDENHLQGYSVSKINLGLFFNDELISLMTFGAARFSKEDDWEIIRFCNKIGYSVVGGASKLLKSFENRVEYKSLVSYADRRWSYGDLYEGLGMTYVGVSNPNYWYFTSNAFVESRLKYQKHKLESILESFDNSLTEQENMINNGYYIIYDCGNIVYRKKRV